MPGLWRKSGIRGGKHLITRRDGSIPEWTAFVLGARDPAAPAALRTYADECERLKYDAAYVADVRELANDFEEERQQAGPGDPTAPPHRKDDPTIIARMQDKGSA